MPSQSSQIKTTYLACTIWAYYHIKPVRKNEVESDNKSIDIYINLCINRKR